MHYSLFKKIKTRGFVFLYRIKNKKKIKPALFLHIQKTAGSSIVNYARYYYPRVISHGDFTEYQLEELEDVPFISGHFGYNFAVKFLKKRYSFVFLRDPVERVLSFYFYCKNRDPDEFNINRFARELELEEFIRLGYTDDLIHSRIFNNQAWQMAYGYWQKKYARRSISDNELQDLSIEHLNSFSYVGFTESFEEDSKIVLSKLGLPAPNSFTQFNEFNVNTKRPGREEISPTALELIHECTRVDQALYDEARSRRRANNKISP